MAPPTKAAAPPQVLAERPPSVRPRGVPKVASANARAAVRPISTRRVPTARTSTAARWLRLLVGLLVFALGLALMLRADLGLSSWDVLHDAIGGLTPLTFGQTVIVVSIVVVVASLGLGVRPGPGTLANVLLVGAFTDAMLATRVLDNLGSTTLLPRLLALVTGIAAIAFATALYIGARLGAGPRDSLMLAAALWLRSSPGTARAAIEGLVLVVGIALGGAVGVGTIVFAVLIGPAINVSFRILGMYVPPRRGTNVLTRAAHAIRKWVSRGQLGASSSAESSSYSGGRI